MSRDDQAERIMTLIVKRHLTDAVLAALQPAGETEQWFVGDHEKPQDGGWQGEPNRSQFVPYVVVTSLPSQAPTGPVRGSDEDVNFPYALSSLGDSRIMVERMTDIARERVLDLRKTQIDGGRTIGFVRVMKYGGVDRLSREPPLYAITDQVVLWTTPTTPTP